MTRRSVLENYWIRVETALWRSRDIEVINDSGFRMEGYCLDFGGGDGTFTFLMNGGIINPSYDSYTFIDEVDGFNQGKDIYDAISSRIDNFVSTSPLKTDSRVINFDHKVNLIEKSKNLSFYSGYKVGDGNSHLDFEDDEFDSIFSNIIYWMEDPVNVLTELSRISKNGSRLCFVVPNHRFSNTSNLVRYDQYRFDKSFLSMIDRGRHSSNIKVSKHPDEWIKTINSSKWSVIHSKSYLSDDLVSYWDIGLRPFSPYIIKAFNLLDARDRLQVKNEWVEGIYPIFDGFLDAQSELESEGSNFNLFICENVK